MNGKESICVIRALDSLRRQSNSALFSISPASSSDWSWRVRSLGSTFISWGLVVEVVEQLNLPISPRCLFVHPGVALRI